MKHTLLLFAVVLLFSCSNNKTVKIVENKKSDYKIFISNNNNEMMKPARILQDYIQKITDVKLAICHSKEKDAKLIELKIETKKSKADYVAYGMSRNNIYIAANNPTYLVYAVYEFLERELNCHFYTPDYETVPKSANLEVKKKLKYKYKPNIQIRTVNSRLFYNNYEFADKLKVTYSAFPFYVNGAGVHTFNKFVPADKYFEKHPEYFSLVNGKRQTTQLCLSNPEVYDIVLKAVEKSFNEQPAAKVISVSQNDNTQYCRCKQCAAIDKEEGSPSGTMIRFVNKIAKNFPAKTISTLAYQYTRKACKTKPAKNVLITLCSIECNRSAPIEEKCKDFANDLKEWKKLTKNIRIWDYTTQFTNFLAPFPNIHTIAPNIRLFANNHAKWVFEQHSNNPSDLFELRSYLLARLMWNPDLKTQDLISEFCNAYYEDASDDIQKYISLMTKNLQNDKDFFLFLYGGPAQAFHSFLSVENLDEYNKIFDSAEDKVKNNRTLLKRVKMARLGLNFVNLEACRARLSDKYSLSNSEFVNREFDSFVKTCKRENVKWLNESGFSLSNYIDLYKKNLERSQTNNHALKAKVKLLSKAKKYANENPQALTDGALGGSSFYANWLGFEGNDMIAIVDLGKEVELKNISVNFLQVINHLVFLPTSVDFYISNNETDFVEIASLENPKPLTQTSKNNDMQIFSIDGSDKKARFIKIHAHNMKTPPHWHHGTGLKSWIFADEIIVE